MPSSSARLGIAIALLVMAVSACVNSTAGEPGPASSGTSTTSPGQDEPSLSPRPREIKLDGLDLCTLWSADHLAQLEVAPEPRRSTSTAGDDLCAFESASQQPPKAAFSVLAVLDHDVIDDFLPGDGDSVIDVDGFPAVRQTASAAGPQPCAVLLSTAAGQYLEVRLTYGSTEAHLSGERACELTVKAATFAMQTLQTQR